MWLFRPRLQHDVSKSSQKAESLLILAATELIEYLARHQYHGVLVRNSKQRAKVTRFANQYYRPDTRFVSAGNARQNAKVTTIANGKLDPCGTWDIWTGAV